MSKKNITLVVNLLGGPGCGKSTMAAGIFAGLKWKGIDCELAAEYAKDLVWEKRFKTFENQVYMFGKQHHRIYRLVGQVDVIVTDSPILLTAIYDSEKRESLRNLMFEEYNKVNNFNILLRRRKVYNPKGRNQTESESKEIDEQIRNLLEENKLPHITVDGCQDAVNDIVRTVEITLRMLHESK